MDKCIMTNADVEALFAWRDRNIDLVRRGSCPCKAIEVIFKDIDSRAKYVRDGNIVTMHYVVGNEVCNYKIEMLPFGYWKIRKKPAKGFGSDVSLIRDIAGFYYALMALITYGDDITYTEPELKVIEQITETRAKQKATQNKTKRDNTIYLFNRQPSGKIVIRKKGERSAPHGEFNVRGHFRHLKSGKVVWINEFKKGVGKHRNKTYKL